MKNYINTAGILMEFDSGLKSLLEENSKETIDRLSCIAINYENFASEFVQYILKKIESVPLKTP